MRRDEGPDGTMAVMVCTNAMASCGSCCRDAAGLTVRPLKLRGGGKRDLHKWLEEVSALLTHASSHWLAGQGKERFSRIRSNKK